MPDNTKKTEPSAPADEKIGIFGKIKNFLSGLVGGNYDDETPFDAGESNTKMVSTISILLIINNYFNVNFLQEHIQETTKTKEGKRKTKKERARKTKQGPDKCSNVESFLL